MLAVYGAWAQWGPYDAQAILIRREPWWTHALVCVVDVACRATGHVWCNSAFMHWALDVSDRHASVFTVPVEKGMMDRYCEWRGLVRLGDDEV